MKKLIFFASLGLFACSAKISWLCNPQEDGSITCVFKGEEGSGEACFDLTVQCKDGKHTEHVCSGKLKKGEVTSQNAKRFQPPLPAISDCDNIDFANKEIK